MKTGPNAFSRCAPALIRIVRSHPRLFMAAVLGLLVIALDPVRTHTSARLLLGWDVGVLVYLLAVYTMMARASLSGLRQRFRHLVQPELGPEGPAPGLVDASPAGHLAQPEDQVGGRLDRPEMAVQLQKNLLRQFFGYRAVVQKVPR